MRTLGIIGGIAPESTIAYYRMFIAEYKRRTADGSLPPIVINSINMTRMLDLISTGKFAEVIEYLAEEIQRLAKAGAEFAFFASNTPHVVFEELHERSPIPLISIVDCAATHAKKLGLKRLGLFGTRFTMQGKFYPETFARDRMQVVLPQPPDQDFIHQKYMSELVEGKFEDQTRDALFVIIGRLIAGEHIDGLILGGTELPLILRTDEYKGIPLLDTSRIHADVAVTEMLRN